jgi:hypothetical protein
MNWDSIDWKALERLRAAFLDETAGDRDYWQKETDLASYDHTFGQRIRWKWNYALADLTRRGWRPPAGIVLDWGCGSGIASRAFLEHFGAGTTNQLHLSDRSLLAMQFAARRVREDFPDVPVWLEPTAPARFAMLLVSHVLTELSAAHREELVALARCATAVIWVEPATHAVSRALIAAREQLRGAFHVVAPCTHEAACGMLATENARHWCHFFAASPPEVFTDGHWARFAKMTGVDLRSLPVSYLALDARATSTPPAPRRVIGTPRVYKAHASLLGCDAGGVREYQTMKREAPDGFRRLKKGVADTYLPARERT